LIAATKQPLPSVTAPPQETLSSFRRRPPLPTSAFTPSASATPPFPHPWTAAWHTVSNIILDFCAILRIMLYAIVYLAFFLASGVLIPVTIRLLLGDTNRKWKPVAAGFLALVLLLSLKL
jgi:hypothetical protein